MGYVYIEELSAEENTARALVAIANELSKLGLAGASTELGALEVVAKELKDGLSRVTEDRKSVV